MKDEGMWARKAPPAAFGVRRTRRSDQVQPPGLPFGPAALDADTGDDQAVAQHAELVLSADGLA